MTNQVFYKEGYSENYIKSRREIDDLCLRIMAGEGETARREYEGIEQAFVQAEPEKAELFKMIYSNRIERLCRQFPSGGA